MLAEQQLQLSISDRDENLSLTSTPYTVNSCVISQGFHKISGDISSASDSDSVPISEIVDIFAQLSGNVIFPPALPMLTLWHFGNLIWLMVSLQFLPNMPYEWKNSRSIASIIPQPTHSFNKIEFCDLIKIKAHWYGGKSIRPLDNISRWSGIQRRGNEIKWMRRRRWAEIFCHPTMNLLYLTEAQSLPIICLVNWIDRRARLVWLQEFWYAIVFWE